MASISGETGYPLGVADIKTIMKSNNIPYNRYDIPYYDKFSRFGVMDPYNKLTFGKEYLFFTKPDLHIYEPNTTTLQPALANDGFFIDLVNRHPNVIGQLQSSAGTIKGTEKQSTSPFMNILTNSVKNSLDLSGLTAGEMDGPNNMWGGTMKYRKDAWAGDEQVEFSLEFEDTKFLDIYYMTKAYELYHRYMMAGYIYPPNLSQSKVDENGNYFDSYTKNKESHTTFGIYKFIVDDDYSTLLYWAYICGAYFNSVPRDAFNNINGNTDGLKYTLDFKAFCVDDMNPQILANFNSLVLSNYVNSEYATSKLLEYKDDNGSLYVDRPSTIDTYTRINGEWPSFPIINQVNRTSKLGLPETMKYKYELNWFS